VTIGVDTPAPRLAWIVTGLVLVALLVRLAVVFAIGTPHLLYDELAYRWGADAGRPWTHWPPFVECRPPGYLLFLYGLGRFGTDARWLLSAQALVSALALVPLVALGRSWVGWRAALVAALVIALSPVHVGYAALFMSEALYVTLLLAALALLFRRDAPRWVTLTAGLTFAAACLVRGVPTPFIAVVLLWAVAGGWWEPREGLRRAGAFALGVALVLGPWTARNAVVFGEFIPTDCQTMYNLWQGNNPVQGWNLGLARRYARHSTSPQAREAFAREKVLAYVLEDPAGWAWNKITVQVPRLLVGMDGVHRNLLRHHRFGVLSERTEAGLAAASTAAWLVVGAAGIAGLVLLPGDPRRTLVLLFGAFVVCVHVIGFAHARHRLPLEPLLALGVGVLLVRPAAAWQPTPGRIVVAAVLAAIVGALAVVGG
jgi:4-amino-4-deoxy-L-arabinose transferase-like glycosyltransferase